MYGQIWVIGLMNWWGLLARWSGEVNGGNSRVAGIVKIGIATDRNGRVVGIVRIGIATRSSRFSRVVLCFWSLAEQWRWLTLAWN